MSTMSEAYAAIDAERQAREQEARARAAEIEPGPEERALTNVAAGAALVATGAMPTRRRACARAPDQMFRIP